MHFYMRQKILGPCKDDGLILVGFMAVSNYAKEDRNAYVSLESLLLGPGPLSSSLPKTCLPYCKHTTPFLQACLTN